MDIVQFIKKGICGSRSLENISDKRMRIEVQRAQTNGVERAKRLAVNVHLHCIVRNLKRISKTSTLPSWKNFCRSPWMHWLRS